MDSLPNHQSDLLLRILHQQILPWAKSALGPRIVFAEPSRTAIGIEVRRCSVPPLDDVKHDDSGVLLARWPGHHLNAIRVPFIGFVIEGEADFAIGATRQMVSDALDSTPLYGRYILTLPAVTCCVVPPGVPHSDGSQPLWERATPAGAFSRVLWLHVLPTGAICHLSTSTGTKQCADPYHFVYDPKLSEVCDMLTGELREREKDFETAARNYLVSLLIRLERALGRGGSPTAGATVQIGSHFTTVPEVAADSNSAVHLRACHYIQLHLHEDLTPAMIARHVFVSVPQLNRIFKGQEMTVMNYVTELRRETAESLLEGTSLAIAHVGRLVGYPNASHFTHAFQRWTGISPSAYRKRAGR